MIYLSPATEELAMLDITAELADRIRNAASVMLAESIGKEYVYLDLLNTLQDRFGLSWSSARRAVSIMCDSSDHGWAYDDDDMKESVEFYGLK
jgi:hypothetical protein